MANEAGCTSGTGESAFRTATLTVSQMCSDQFEARLDPASSVTRDAGERDVDDVVLRTKMEKREGSSSSKHGCSSVLKSVGRSESVDVDLGSSQPCSRDHQEGC